MDRASANRATVLNFGCMNRKFRTARALLSLLVVLAAVGVITSTSNAASAGTFRADPCTGADCDVVGDPDQAAYVGTGGLLLPAASFSGSSDDRTAAATCATCRWALGIMCRGDSPDSPCSPAAQSCPADQRRYVVLLWRPETPVWTEIGLVCLSPAGPTTVADVAATLHDRVLENVPDLLPTMQPADRTLIQLPTLFASGQPEHLGERTFDLVGFQIVLQGKATWDWDFGDGASVSTQEPGGAWPDTSVAHTFTSAGHFPVEVTSSWEAWFTVDGMGPFRVGGEPVVQVAPPLDVEVLQARAELVAN